MKEYWCVNYNEVEDEMFGNVCGLIFSNKGDAWNCACNDANEYLIGAEDCVLDIMPDDCRIICRNVKDNSYKCIWELQYMNMSNDVNEIDS